jgi:hypothetical protein
MTGFQIRTAEGTRVRFMYYNEEAPVTVAAFAAALPFTRLFLHARVSGEEFWIDDAPELDIIQENASVFTEPGEAVMGPLRPARARTAGCMGIYYGEGKGLDCGNIFARVFDEDLAALRELGDEIWRQGGRELTVEHLDG